MTSIAGSLAVDLRATALGIDYSVSRTSGPILSVAHPGTAVTRGQ